EVEEPFGAPAMFVVADQDAIGAGGKRRLAGTGETEEDRRIARMADVDRAMHRHHAALRQMIIEEGEDRFLDLSGIAGAADEDHALRQVASDDGFGADAVFGGIGLEAWKI